MKYSFTAVQPKRIFSKIVKIWWFYIFLSVFLIGAFSINLKIQTEQSTKNSKDMVQKQDFYYQQIQKVQSNQKRLEYELLVIKDDITDNMLVKDAIDNLLNLIPDQITISLIEIKDQSLVIKGNTPSKEVFRYLLQDPLKAIFGESKVSFFMLSNGGYEFVSESHTEQSFIRNIQEVE
ncbi:hypothetical protein CQA57_04470 [Helicobacter anseris]|uniref:Pilus assembly protein PilN n=1 Tax=Helicobacter anseris TaxID=375926 RepID=A0A3D8J9M1_9HELI|nr:hypothetical protein [Helicobacter anseris]RDU73564.1 hypothetical protein CQA57_04470 [Helicobacter anseris]